MSGEGGGLRAGRLSPVGFGKQKERARIDIAVYSGLGSRKAGRRRRNSFPPSIEITEGWRRPKAAGTQKERHAISVSFFLCHPNSIDALKLLQGKHSSDTNIIVWESMLPIVSLVELRCQTIPNAFRIFIGTEEGKLFIDSNKETGYYPSRSNEIGPIYIIDDSSG